MASARRMNHRAYPAKEERKDVPSCNAGKRHLTLFRRFRDWICDDGITLAAAGLKSEQPIETSRDRIREQIERDVKYHEKWRILKTLRSSVEAYEVSPENPRRMEPLRARQLWQFTPMKAAACGAGELPM